MYKILMSLMTIFASTIVLAQNCPGGICENLSRGSVKNSCITESRDYRAAGRRGIFEGAQEKLQLSQSPVGKMYSDYCRRIVINNGEGERQFIFCGESALEEAQNVIAPGTNSILIGRNTPVIERGNLRVEGDYYGVFAKNGDLYPTSCPEDSSTRAQEYTAALDAKIRSIHQTNAIEITNSVNGAAGADFICNQEASQ